MNYGQYFIGNNGEAAEGLFKQLKGTSPVDQAMLHVDLMEMVDELPVKIKTIGCTLDELCENTKLITREIFRLQNLKEIN